jgi:hypothetical protein
MIDNHKFDESSIMMISLIFTGLYLGALLIHGWKHFKTIRLAEEEAISTYFTATDTPTKS